MTTLVVDNGDAIPPDGEVTASEVITQGVAHRSTSLCIDTAPMSTSRTVTAV